ncbi:FmdB family zinc ribbon protein [Micromonospora sp. NBS 11-29]|uniref:FmdB family zinc ribbon protein n=1 Tax=Micromonospora sp. NBS 11-29 TaxID=1960879 RepID=UPI0034E8AB05
MQSFSDEPLTECPACEGRLRKLFNSVGIVFKGSGFYRTDSRASGSENANGTASKPAKSESSPSSPGSSSPGSSSSGSSSSGSSSSGSSSSGSSGSGSGPAASKASAASSSS